MIAMALRASVARAAPPSPEALACVSASTDGQVARDRGQLLAARSQFRTCAQPSCPSVVTKSCTEWLIELDRRIPSLVVRVRGEGARDLTHASVLLDGAAVTLDGRPIELDPGPHDVAASASGWQAAEQKVLLAEGEQRRLVLLELQSATPLEPAPAAPAPVAPRREPAVFQVPVGSWILGGVGVIGIASFLVLRGQAAGELSHLQQTCAPDCPPARSDPGRRFALAADLSLGIGAVALVAAGTWALVRWLGREPSTTTTVALLPTHAGLTASLAIRY